MSIVDESSNFMMIMSIENDYLHTMFKVCKLLSFKVFIDLLDLLLTQHNIQKAESKQVLHLILPLLLLSLGLCLLRRVDKYLTP